MSTTKHLFIGFGDIARRCAEKLSARGEEVIGIARSRKDVPDGVTLLLGDIREAETIEQLRPQRWENVLVTLTPDGRTPEDYRATYFDAARALCALWQTAAAPPKRIVFISSTRVYGQSADEWVDEASDTSQADAQGQAICEAENVLLSSGLPITVLRLSGIYGPGRDFLIRQVREGRMGDDHFTNRVHIDDVCAVIDWLFCELPADQGLGLLLASDSSPVRSRQIREWLAVKLGLAPNKTFEASEALEITGKMPHNQTARRAGSKRCDNRKLLALGYVFKYPTYVEGYHQVLSHEQDA